MNEPKPAPQPDDRRKVMLKNVRENAAIQSSLEYQENYLRSCEAHGGDMAEVVTQVRTELSAVRLLKV